MLKNFSQISFYFVFVALLFTAAACQSIIMAQEKSKIVSGNYESLVLGVNSDGELTGHFHETTGMDEEGNARFSCEFFVYGAKESGGSYKIKTWHPEYPEEVVEGVLKVVENGVNVKLDGEHGGCWNVAPVLKEKEGLDFTFDSKGDWQSVRMISPKRVYLFKSVDAGTPQKIYVDRNDVVKVFQTKDNWAEVRYASPNGRSAYGWMKTSDFYALEPIK